MSTAAPTDIADITVESIGGLGDGIAHYHGKPLFIPKSCVGDRLAVRIVKETTDRLQGEITDILQRSNQRRAAPCLHFERCGGCTLQQMTPDAYREFKTKMLHTALQHAGSDLPGAAVVFLPEASRRRVEFKLRRSGGKAALAFHELHSHTLTEISECLVIRPQLQALIAPLNGWLATASIARHLLAVGLTITDSGIDMLLQMKKYTPEMVPEMEAMAAELDIARVAVEPEDGQVQVVVRRAAVELSLGEYRVPLPPNAFLQASDEAQQWLTAFCAQATKGADRVIDLFAGIGTYSFPLCRHATVHAVEGDAALAGTVRKAIERQGIPNLSAERRDLFADPVSASELNRYDAAILNPPRAGAKAQAEQLALSDIRTVAMISCNPTTFARDAKILTNAGFSLIAATGIDQFIWSHHLEIAAVLKR